MKMIMVAMTLTGAFGLSAVAAEPAKPSAAKLVAAANTLAACLMPLAREADETAAKMRMSRLNHLERKIVDTKEKLLTGKPRAFPVAVMIDSLASAAGHALYFNSEIEIKVAQCIEAACPVLDDAASDNFSGRAATCRQSALGLRQRAAMPR